MPEPISPDSPLRRSLWQALDAIENHLPRWQTFADEAAALGYTRAAASFLAQTELARTRAERLRARLSALTHTSEDELGDARTRLGIQRGQTDRVRSLAAARAGPAPLPHASRQEVGPDVMLDLTRRQADVVRLVAQGRTNREIEQELVLARGVAANYVHAALRRVGLRNRSQLAAWWASQERGPGLGEAASSTDTASGLSFTW